MSEIFSGYLTDQRAAIIHITQKAETKRDVLLDGRREQVDCVTQVDRIHFKIINTN